MTSQRISIGCIPIAISDDKFTQSLLADFPYLEYSDAKPRLTVDMKAGFREPPDGYIETSDDCYVTENGFFIDNRTVIPSRLKEKFINKIGRNGYQVFAKKSKNGLYKIEVHYDQKIFGDSDKLLRQMLKYRNRSFLGRGEKVIKNFLYDFFEPLIQLGLLKQECSFIHASGVSNNDNAIIFTGLGGTGKTSISRELTQTTDMKLLGDDFTILSSDGRVYPYLKPLWVTKLERDSMRKEKKFFSSWLDAVQWHNRHKKSNDFPVRRRMRLDTYYGMDNLCVDPVDIDTVIHLIRKDTGEIEINSMTRNSCASQSASNVVSDLSPFMTEYLPLIHSVSCHWPSLGSVQNNTEEVFSEALHEAELMELVIPLETTPKSIKEKINDVIS